MKQLLIFIGGFLVGFSLIKDPIHFPLGVLGEVLLVISSYVESK